jgi:predicted outer membrane protein
VAGVIPNVNFIASASRMASTYSASDKLRNLAAELAKSQTAVANSLTARVNVRPVESSSIRVGAAQLLPAQVSNLQQLSTSRGRGFDSLYVSTTKAALVQLQTLYREFIGQTGVDPGLQAIAERELPKWSKQFRRLTLCEAGRPAGVELRITQPIRADACCRCA